MDKRSIITNKRSSGNPKATISEESVRKTLKSSEGNARGKGGKEDKKSPPKKKSTYQILKNIENKENSKKTKADLDAEDTKPKVCPICQNVKTNNSLKYTCGHIACGICIYRDILLEDFEYFNELKEEYELVCPVCKIGKRSTKLEEIKLVLDKTARISHEKINFQCKFHEGKILEDYCKECKKWLCALCKSSFHDIHFPNHKLSKEKVDKRTPCNVHNLDECDLYCLDCEEQICHKCLFKGEYHYEHKNILISEFKEYVLNNKQGMKYKTYNEFESFIDTQYQNFKANFNKNFNDNKTIIEEAMQSLDKLLKEYISKYKKYSEFIDNIFTVIKDTYKEYYYEINRTDLTFNTLSYLQKINKEMTNFTFIINKEENFNEIKRNLKEINPKELFTYKAKFDIRALTLKNEIKVDSEIYSVNLMKHGYLCVGLKRGDIVFYDLKTFAPICVCHGHNRTVYVAKEISNDFLATGGGDSDLKLWDLSGERTPFIKAPEKKEEEKKEEEKKEEEKEESKE
ncbi:MAG: hypothetical protein MJ252_05455, partial [archaeon]|nr:hypothetical protein [archaeon]